MTLGEKLKTITGKCKIGAVNGSAFFYAGKAEGAEKAFTDQGYEDMLDRNVKETYGSITGDGTIILVDGKERGGYWRVEESDGTIQTTGKNGRETEEEP